jgi:hypothetical protein
MKELRFIIIGIILSSMLVISYTGLARAFHHREGLDRVSIDKQRIDRIFSGNFIEYLPGELVFEEGIINVDDATFKFGGSEVRFETIADMTVTEIDKVMLMSPNDLDLDLYEYVAEGLFEVEITYNMGRYLIRRVYALYES